MTKLMADLVNGVTRTDDAEIAEKGLERMSPELFYAGLSSGASEGGYAEVDDELFARIDAEYGIH
ncbi:MAG: hypothetical protein WC455_13940 [Dehalococcoidia bacterium]